MRRRSCRRVLVVDRHAGLGLLAQLGGLDLDAGVVERLAHGGELGRAR